MRVVGEGKAEEWVEEGSGAAMMRYAYSRSAMEAVMGPRTPVD